MRGLVNISTEAAGNSEPGGAGKILLEGGQEKREKLGLGDTMRSLYSSVAKVKLQQPDSCYAKFSEYNIFDIWFMCHSTFETEFPNNLTFSPDEQELDKRIIICR